VAEQAEVLQMPNMMKEITTNLSELAINYEQILLSWLKNCKYFPETSQYPYHLRYKLSSRILNSAWYEKMLTSAHF